MKNHRTLLQTVAALSTVGLGFAGLAGSAHADAPLTTFLQVWDAKNPSVQSLQEISNLNTILETKVDDAWAANSVAVCDAIKAEIEKPRKVGKDELRGYDTICQLAPSGTLTIGNSGFDTASRPVINFSYKTRNYVEFTGTQPYVDAWGNPRMSLTFDLTVNYQLGVNISLADGSQPAQPLTLISAKASLSNAVADTHGPIADVVKAAVDWYMGPHFIQQTLDGMITKQHIQVPASAGQIDMLNAQFTASLGSFRLTGALGVPSENQLILLVTNPWTTDTSAGIGGTVTWNNNGTSQPSDCNVFGFAADLQTGPAPIINWSTKETGQALHYKYGATNVSFSADDENNPGTGFCQYTIAGLPSGVPATVAPTSGVGASNGNGSVVASLVNRLTPSQQTVTPDPVKTANFVLTTSVQDGGGLGEVQLTPEVNGGDPAPEENAGINFRDIFIVSQRQAILDAANQNEATAPAAPSVWNLSKLKLGNVADSVAEPPAPNLGKLNLDRQIFQNAAEMQGAPPAPNLGMLNAAAEETAPPAPSKLRLGSSFLRGIAQSNEEAAANQQVIR